MRIVILSLILSALLLPGLRAEAVAPPLVALHPTTTQQAARGTVGSTVRGGQLTLQLDASGLPAPTGARSVYVVWLADTEQRLINAGSLALTPAGAATATLGPFPLAAAGLVVAISAAPCAPVVAPSAPRASVILSGQFPPVATSPLDRLSTFLGPDWFAPILPAALGLTLLRQVGRSRRVAPR